MANQTTNRAIRNKVELLQLLLVVTFLLGVSTGGVWTYLARQLPWLTALSILIVVSFGIAGASQFFKPPAQKLWGVLLLLAIGLYFGSLSYQAWGPARKARYLAWVTLQPPDSAANQVIAIAYPRLVPLEVPGQRGWPLSVYLWPPVLAATSTITGASPSAASVVTATIPGQMTKAIATETPLAQTSTPVPPPTPAPMQVMSYTVIFEPYDNGLLFTDKDGVPVPPQVVVETGQSPDKPAVLYVRRSPLDSVPASVPVKVQVYGADGNPHELAVLQVRLEETYSAWWRHFWGLVLGPTTPLLALAATLVGFGWQWWQEGQKRKQAKLDEIDGVEKLVRQEKLPEARQKLDQVTSRHGHDPDSEIRDALAKARKCVQLERIKKLKILAQTERDEALHQYNDLRREREKEGWTDPELIAALEEAGAAIKRRRLEWPDLWPKERPPDQPAIAAWLTESGTDLKFNPFGPERAEDDPKLSMLFIEPPGWEQLMAPEPTVIFGAEGSGHTVSRLMLAHTCTTTRLGRDHTAAQVDTLPVYLALFPEGKPKEAGLTCWRMLTRALARATLDFLALNPQSFAETSFRQRRALARLFALHRHDLGDLASYLAGEGLDGAVAIHLTRNIQQAGRGTQPPKLTDEAELLATLAEARLSPFQQCYVLAEVPKEVSVRVPTVEIVSGLNPLLQMMQPLAARKVYLKLFVPTDMLNLLKPLPSQVDEVELAWERLALRKMLESRAEQAGAASFRQMFRRLPKGIDAAERLVQTALESEGPPRRLIQLGQELLTEHIRRTPDEPKLSWEALKAVLDRAAQGGVA